MTQYEPMTDLEIEKAWTELDACGELWFLWHGGRLLATVDALKARVKELEETLDDDSDLEVNPGPPYYYET